MEIFRSKLEQPVKT